MTENKLPPLASFEYNQWRSRFLYAVLTTSCGMGLAVFLIGGIISWATPIELTVFTISYLLLLFVTFTSLSYAIKAGTLLAVGYFIGLFTLTRFGPWSDATTFFLATTVLASLLFDQRIDRRVFFLDAMTIITVGVLDILDVLPLSSQFPPAEWGDWAIYIIKYTVLAIPITWAINLSKQEFRSIADRFQSTLQSLSGEYNELKQRVDESTASLVKKTEQLRATSYIARQTAEVENISSLLEAVVNLVTDQFGYYHTGIFLINDNGELAVLQAASSGGGRQMVKKGHSLAVGSQGIVGYVAAHKVPRIALDVGTDAVFFDNPDLPDTRSEIALPLIIHNRTLGVLDIQSEQSQAFSVDDIDALQTLTDQVAVAIENARLLDEAQATLAQIETVTALQTREAWKQRIQKQTHAFTYTPLGLSADAFPEEEDNALNVPITLRGQKIGSISISRKKNSVWNKVDEELINEVADQVGLAVDNIRLLENATQRAQQEKTVGELASRFNQSLDIDSLLQTAARELGQVPEISEVSVFIGQIPEQAPPKRRPKRTTG